MRSPDELDAETWSVDPPIEFYEPGEVPEAIRSIGNVGDAAGASRAANRCLFAIGNNHCGALYPSAPRAVPYIVWYIANGSRWAKFTALCVLEEAVFFEAYVDRTVAASSELHLKADDAFRWAAGRDSREILAVVGDPSSSEAMWSAALSILGRIDLHVDELRQLLAAARLDPRQSTPLPGATFHQDWRAARRGWCLKHGITEVV